MENWISVFAVLSVLGALTIVKINENRTKRILDHIEGMLDSAIQGDFSESSFDESRLSALETKFAHYLSSSVVSAQNVRVEKERIKTMIADISHQTKTPVANLLLYSELLEEQELSEEASANVRALHSQAEKLRFLIESLVKVSRLENGILRVNPSRRELQPMLQKVVEQFLLAATKKGISLKMQPTRETAIFDLKWTSEALCNLVDNAIKYTKEGRVSIDVVAYELFLCIKVADTGEGISEEEQPKVFSRFYRSPEVSDQEGVGIGLYLARKIITEQRGYIKLTSSKGQGATFAVFLPR